MIMAGGSSLLHTFRKGKCLCKTLVCVCVLGIKLWFCQVILSPHFKFHLYIPLFEIEATWIAAEEVEPGSVPKFSLHFANDVARQNSSPYYLEE